MLCDDGSVLTPEPRTRSIHVAILQCNPLVKDRDVELQMNNEETRLKDTFSKSGKQMNLFVSVLTRDALMHVFRNEAQAIHVSGRGFPGKDVLAFENHLGELCETSVERLREALGRSELSTKVVFVSMCHSSTIARCFVEVGIPHVIAIKADVPIRDDYATEFAAVFYETLLKDKTVLQAFNAASAMLSIMEPDCCCQSHDGHADDCRCELCGRFKCCLVCHAPGSECTNCRDEAAEAKCCMPDFPHYQHEKFCLLPNCGCGDHHADDCIHNEKVFFSTAVDDKYSQPPSKALTTSARPSPPPLTRCVGVAHSSDSLAMGRVMDISPKPKTNVRMEERRLCIVGRQGIVQRLVKQIHPTKPAVSCFFLLYGLNGVGKTTVARSVARFFVRPWLRRPFPGGVWFIDLKSWDSTYLPLVSQIANEMGIEVAKGFFYTTDSDGMTRKYDAVVQEQLRDAQLARAPQLVHFSSAMTVHFLFVRKTVMNSEVKEIVGDTIWKELKAVSPLLFPLEVFQAKDGTVKMQTVTYSPAAKDKVLGQICSECIGDSLFIFDQFNENLEQRDLHRFLEGFNMFAKALPSAGFPIVFNQKHNDILVKLAPDIRLRFRPIHLAPIQPLEAHCLLKLQSRDLLQAYDFAEIAEENRPKSEDELVQYTLFKLMARSPALVYMCAELLTSSLLPLYVPMFCADEPERGRRLLEPLKEELLQRGIDYSQAQKSLDSFIAALNSLRPPVSSMATASAH